MGRIPDAHGLLEIWIPDQPFIATVPWSSCTPGDPILFLPPITPSEMASPLLLDTAHILLGHGVEGRSANLNLVYPFSPQSKQILDHHQRIVQALSSPLTSLTRDPLAIQEEINRHAKRLCWTLETEPRVWKSLPQIPIPTESPPSMCSSLTSPHSPTDRSGIDGLDSPIDMFGDTPRPLRQTVTVQSYDEPQGQTDNWIDMMDCPEERLETYDESTGWRMVSFELEVPDTINRTMFRIDELTEEEEDVVDPLPVDVTPRMSVLAEMEDAEPRPSTEVDHYMEMVSYVTPMARTVRVDTSIETSDNPIAGEESMVDEAGSSAMTRMPAMEQTEQDTPRQRESSSTSSRSAHVDRGPDPELIVNEATKSPSRVVQVGKKLLEASPKAAVLSALRNSRPSSSRVPVPLLSRLPSLTRRNQQMQEEIQYESETPMNLPLQYPGSPSSIASWDPNSLAADEPLSPIFSTELGYLSQRRDVSKSSWETTSSSAQGSALGSALGPAFVESPSVKDILRAGPRSPPRGLGHKLRRKAPPIA